MTKPNDNEPDIACDEDLVFRAALGLSGFTSDIFNLAGEECPNVETLEH